MVDRLIGVGGEFAAQILAYDLLFRPEAIRARAGTGQREGFEDAGPLKVTRS